MQFQVIQRFTALEPKMVDREVRFDRRREIGGSGDGERKHQQAGDAHGSIITSVIAILPIMI